MGGELKSTVMKVSVNLWESIAEDIIDGSSRFAINSVVFSEVLFNLLKLLYEDKYGEYRFYEWLKEIP